MHGDCDRVRQWVSADVDGELSTFERILLADHLAGCRPCREFRASVDGLTSSLRAAPSEQFEGIVIGRVRRRARLRLAPAAAAMAVAVVGLGSILASAEIRPNSASRVSPARVSSAVAGTDTMNLSTAKALERLHAAKVAQLPSAVHRSLSGGPVLLEP
jgi:predicted anti-sigma-YlaC factor YlaD